MALEVFANNPATTVLSGGGDTPASGTQQTWTVASSGAFPAASSTASPPTQFHIADEALTGEIIAVTNVSGTTWTVLRGAEGTVPAVHQPNFTVTQVVTAGGLGGFVQTSQMTSAIATETTRAEAAEANLLSLPTGTPAVGQVPTVTQVSPLALDWATPATGGGGVQLGGDIGGTNSAPLVQKIQGTSIAAPSGSATQFLDGTGHWSTPAGTGGSMSNPMSTAGDTIYGGASGAPQRLAGNTTATRQFLTETGTGTAANAPAWNTLQASDIPTLNQNTTGTAANVTGTVALANGGTGQTSQQTALNALAGGVTSGQYLRGNGTNVSLSAIQAADVPTLNQSTTGTAANVTGTVALANGGTGQATAQAALNALAAGVTSGSYLRGNGTNVALSSIQAADVPTLNQSTTGNAATATNLASGATLPGYVAPKAVTLTYGTTMAVNAALGNAFNLTLTASTGTISNPTNPVDGQVIRFRITQGTGGSFTVAWGTAYDFGTGTAPTLSTTAAKVDIVAFEYVASLSKWACLGSGIGY